MIIMPRQIFRRLGRIPAGADFSLGIYQAVILNVVGFIAGDADPAGLNSTVLAQAIIGSVDLFLFDIGSVLAWNRFLSVGSEIVPVLTITGSFKRTGVLVLILIFLRRGQFLPSGHHNAHIIAVIHVIQDPASLHGAGISKIIILTIDLHPFFFRALAVISEIIPVIPTCFPAVCHLKPFIGDHDTAGIYIVIIVIDPFVGCHGSAAFQITPGSILCLTPRIGYLASIVIIVYPVAAFL